MKKSVTIIVIIAVLAALTFWMVGKYNAIVTAEENVKTAWAQVENQYQRRSDLIPNLVATVKGYAAHESQVMESVVAARAKATQAVVDPSQASPEQLAAYQASQGELSQALGRLLAVTENYPDLKADKNFRELQEQLEGTENRITVARNAFNESAKEYNRLIRLFPNNIVASIFGFQQKAYFAAEAGAEKAPVVAF